MFKRLSEFFKKGNKPKSSPLFIIACILALTIPTGLAITYAVFYQQTFQNKTTKIEMKLYDENDKLLLSETVTSDKIASSSMIELFYKKEPTPSPSENFEPYSNFKCVIKDENGTTNYICHFTHSQENSYIETSSGFFKPDKDCYSDFLNSDFSEVLYTYSKPPELLTTDKEAIIPSTVEWNYKKENGNFSKSNKCTVTDQKISYKMSEEINMEFKSQPDECTVQIFDKSKKQIYNGTLEDLSALTVEIGEHLTAKITAKWEEKADSDFFGTATYDFEIFLGSRVEFAIDITDISGGEFLVISAKNVDDLQKIKYTPSQSFKNSLDAQASGASELAALNALYQFEPKFSKSSDMAYALIPFEHAIPSGKFEFSLSCGATEQLFSVNIKKATAKSYTSFEKNADDMAIALSNESLNAFKALTDDIEKVSQSVIFASTAFDTVSSETFKKGYSFANTVALKNSNEDFVASGNEYISITQSNVSSMGNGIVIETGFCEYLGNYAVIDHGMGVRTWYANLNYCNVSKGQLVKKGDSIGECGIGDIVSGNGFLLMCTAYNTFIDPEFIFGRVLIK